MLKILRKISSLLLKKYALNLQKNAGVSVIMPTLKNRAERKIFQCQNREDFAFDEPFALRFASGTILQIVMEKIRKICRQTSENTLKIRNYLPENETILNGGCHA